MNSTSPFGRLGALLALMFAATALFASGGADTIDPADLEGEMVYLEGQVGINGAPAEIGDVVRPGDRIVTGGGSVAEVTFGKKNILQFQENSETVIDPAWAGVELERGTVAAVLNGLSALGFGDDNRFQVHTTTAVMAVRGTSFFVKSDDADSAYFCTCNGKLHIEAVEGGLGEDTEAYHHDAIWYVQTPEGIRKYPSGLHYHDDGDLNDIALRARTRVAWKD